MRDGAILGIAGTLEKHIARDITALHELTLANRTRIEAIEGVLFGRRFSLVVCMALSIFNPRRLCEKMEVEHETIIDQWNKMAVARAKEIEKERRIITAGNGHG